MFEKYDFDSFQQKLKDLFSKLKTMRKRILKQQNIFLIFDSGISVAKIF